MPFKPGDRIGNKNHKFNPNKEHGVEVVPWEEARWVKTKTGDVIPKSELKGQTIVDWAKDKNELL